MTETIWTCMGCEARFATLMEINAHLNADDSCPDETSVKKFEKILELEFTLRNARTSVAFAPANLPDYQWQMRQDAVKRHTRALHDAIDLLSTEELAMFGSYRMEAS